MIIPKPPAGLSRRFAFLAFVVLAVIWLWAASGRPYTLPSQINWTIYSNTIQASPNNSKSTDVFDFPTVDSEPIRSICSDTQWNASIVFACDNSVGGIGNIRNSILNCVRYAISAGGGLVVPKIIVRDSGDISKIRTSERTTMDYMFDSQHFTNSLQISCPGLILYRTIEDIPNFGETKNLIPLLPEDIVGQVPSTGLTSPGTWRETFYNWLEQYKSEHELKVIDLGRSYLTYPIYSDGEGFALEFGEILKFRADVRKLATETLYRLAEHYSLSLDLSQPIMKNTFFGAHLRTEKDANETWPVQDWEYQRYEKQSALFLGQAAQCNTSIIYVASGDLTEVGRLAEDAKAINATVTSKFDLLHEEEKEILKSLAWDQQGMVDFLVMLKASEFAGIGHSSFAWNIALKRHVHAKQRNHLNGPQMLSDELSQIHGRINGYPEYAACLWP